MAALSLGNGLWWAVMQHTPSSAWPGGSNPGCTHCRQPFPGIAKLPFCRSGGVAGCAARRSLHVWCHVVDERSDWAMRYDEELERLKMMRQLARQRAFQNPDQQSLDSQVL